MTDAVSEQSAVALAGHSTWFYNPIAAVPSLHCGFAMAIGIAVAAAVQRAWLKVLALSLGPARGALDGRDRQPLPVRRRRRAGDHGRRLRRRHVPPAPRAPSRPGARHDPRRDPRSPPARCGPAWRRSCARRPGIVPVGAAADRHALLPLLYRTDPDVVLVDQLQLCLTRAGPASAARASCSTRPARASTRSCRRPSRARRRSSTRPAARRAAGRDPRRARPADDHAAAAAARRGSGSAAPTGRSSRCAWPARRDREIAATVGMPRARAGRPHRGDPRRAQLKRPGRRARRREPAPRGMTRRPWRRCCAGGSRPSSWTGRAWPRSGCSSGGRRPAGRSPARGP